jgi:hypothetical protein
MAGSHSRGGGTAGGGGGGGGGGAGGAGGGGGPLPRQAPPVHLHLDVFGAAAHVLLELKHVQGGDFQLQGGVGGGAGPEQISQCRQWSQVPQLAHEQFFGWQLQNGGCRVAHAGPSGSCCCQSCCWTGGRCCWRCWCCVGAAESAAGAGKTRSSTRSAITI